MDIDLSPRGRDMASAAKKADAGEGNRYVSALKRRFPLLIALGVVVIAIANFTDAVEKFSDGVGKVCGIIGIDACSSSKKPLSLPTEPLVKLGDDLFHAFRKATIGKRPPLQESEFQIVNNLITAIEQLDKSNGHATYYSGAKLRWLGQREASHGYFYKYLQLEPERAAENADRDTGNVVVCLKRANGYCRERTSWIRHQLAFDLYCEALQYHDESARTTLLKRSLEFVEAVIRDRPKTKGFDQRPTTVALKSDLERALALGRAQSGVSSEVSAFCPVAEKTIS